MNHFPKINPTQTEAWKLLSKHFQEMKKVKMQDLFTQNPSRASQFSITWNDLTVKG